MRPPISISQLADEVLQSVVADARVKTASAHARNQPVYTIDAARMLRKLADDLREEEAAGPVEDDVTMDDIGALQDDPEVQELLMLLEQNPELLQQLLAEQSGEAGPEEVMPEEVIPEEAVPADMPPNAAVEAPPDAEAAEAAATAPPVTKENDPEISPPLPKQASVALRQVAQRLRRQAVAQKATSAIKAAAVFHAAKGIHHLVGG